MRKKSRFGAILGNRCPRCFQGKLFSSRAYQLNKAAEMHKKCQVCNEDFEREPGFYFGAAYVSYALTVALWIAVLVALICFDWWGWISFSFFEDVSLFLICGIGVLLILMPIILRLSRSIWINMFTKQNESD